MKTEPLEIARGFHSVRRLTIAVVAAWTLAITGSLIWNLVNTGNQTRELATMEARAHFNKDQAFRFWASSHGGVYVPADARTPPNPKLDHIPERDIRTPSGRELTLMNPAYMLRQMMTEYAGFYGVKGKITSLKLFNPINAPDEWETGALHAFDAGADEIFEISEINGAPYMRLIRPMKVQEDCLKCHGFQGYKVGDVRGGVGVSVPMAPYLAMERRQDVINLGSHGAIWLIGIFAIALVARRSSRRHAERIRADGILADKSRELERANEELQQFAFAAAHDLQEPLRAIMAHTQLVRRRLDGRLDDETGRSIGFAVDAAMSMRSRIADIQSYLRTAETLDLAGTVDTNAIVAEVVNELKADAAGAVFDLARLPQVTADGGQLRRIFRVLIGNAVKYHATGRTPKVAVSARKLDAEWEFAVADNGIGIAPEHHARIFGVFKRLHAQDEYPGTGMGLAICKKIVERHHGQIRVSSEPGKGSTFFFTLPV